MESFSQKQEEILLNFQRFTSSDKGIFALGKDLITLAELDTKTQSWVVHSTDYAPIIGISSVLEVDVKGKKSLDNEERQKILREILNAIKAEADSDLSVKFSVIFEYLKENVNGTKPITVLQSESPESCWMAGALSESIDPWLAASMINFFPSHIENFKKLKEIINGYKSIKNSFDEYVKSIMPIFAMVLKSTANENNAEEKKEIFVKNVNKLKQTTIGIAKDHMMEPNISSEKVAKLMEKEYSLEEVIDILTK